MQFTIDGQCFAVAIASRPLFKNGQPCKARIDFAVRRVWISDQLPRHERRRELFHELRHGWRDSRGPAPDDERDAIDAGEMMDTVFAQYADEGGDATLEALDPETQPITSREPTGMIASNRSDCGLCGAQVMVGSIASSPPRWSADLGAFVIDRGMCCDACNSVTTWTEAATADGMPTGAIVPFPKPQVLTGRDAGKWMAAHASDCRIVSA